MSSIGKVKRRSESNCPVFGAPKELSKNFLPTFEDMVKYYLYVRQDLKPDESIKEPTVTEVSEIVASDIEKLWNKASIPIVTHKRVLQLIRSYHAKYKGLLKSFKKGKISAHYQAKFKEFRDKASARLFDISACKCDFSSCCCEKSDKVPVQERAFLHDQRTVRKMAIGTIDITTTKVLKRKAERKSQENARLSKIPKIVKKTAPVFSESSSSSLEIDINDGSFMPSISKKSTFQTSANELFSTVRQTEEPSSQQMRLALPTLARECDRYGVSDRAAAAISSAVLQDVGLVTDQDSSHIIDRSKIMREKKKRRKNKIIQDLEKPLLLRGLYFDGRKDKTLQFSSLDRKTTCKTVVEEHVTLVQEPESKYLGHVTPSSGTAKNITKSIIDYLTENEICTDNIVAIGCDGTNVNTGKNGGVIRLLEVHLKKPLQWFVCQLHSNELPLRHLLEHFDGATAGPRVFSGPIGKALYNCEQLPIISFQKIPVKLPEVNMKELSTDQKYLFEVCQAVSSGQCSKSLSRRQPGTLSHSRWLTTASRILRLYMSTDNPSQNLFILVKYVMEVYAPMWFCIKTHHSCKDGPKHIFELIKKSRYLSDEIKKVIDPVIQRNAFFAHTENLLLAMITDRRKFIRELGLRRIMAARAKKTTGIRKFTIPDLNFDAKDYYELISWQNLKTSEPPLTKGISDEDLKRMVVDGATEVFDFPNYPCHTQSVERCVKLVTEAAMSVCGATNRDGFIRVRLESRQLMPHFNTKAEYRQ